mmetsp:Transcript_5953/g.11279  ORF Transcript_5953/g.11279 Transcript_5953/m.11279 type:complete len:463 (-) Transcript_5953:46-1434(-)
MVNWATAPPCRDCALKGKFLICCAFPMKLTGLLILPALASATLTGVNLGGWYLIEEWMFSNGQFDRVAEMSDLPQGVIMPPLLPDGLGENWYGEGDLVNKISSKYDDDFAVKVIEAHRDSYITDEDIKKMKESNITAVRMPLGWWAFVEESLSDTPVVITDPAHSDMKFVTITHDALASQIKRFADEDIDVLLDIHAMPGGSSQGSYSGIFPSTPMFWDSGDLLNQGLDIVTALCDFYLGLDSSLQSHVTGVTLINEPAHNMNSEGALTEKLTAWLSQAIDIYRQKVVLAAENVPVPMLYVNLIETALQPQQIVDFFHDTFSASELEEWAILDIHHYFAWDGGHNGCYDGSCAYTCADSATSEGLDSITSLIGDGAVSSHQFFFDNGTIPLVSCSEYSLATYDLSASSCRGSTILTAMHDEQAKGFENQGLYGAYFWTWKMPYGGTHEEAWSLKNFLGIEES